MHLHAIATSIFQVEASSWVEASQSFTAHHDMLLCLTVFKSRYVWTSESTVPTPVSESGA